MAGRIARKEFVRRPAGRVQADEAEAARWLDGMLEEIFRSGSGLTLPGFGGFYLEARLSGWAFRFNPGRRLRTLSGLLSIAARRS